VVGPLLVGWFWTCEGSVNYCYGDSGVQFTGHEEKSLTPRSLNLLQGLCSQWCQTVSWARAALTDISRI